MRLIKEKDLPDFENLRSAVWWVMKVSISLSFCFTLLVIILRRTLYLKAHTDQTRFGNATRILDFQCRLTLILFHVF